MKTVLYIVCSLTFVSVGFAYEASSRNFVKPVSIEKQCQALNPSDFNDSVQEFLLRNKMISAQEKLYVAAITSNLNSCFFILSIFPNELSDTTEILAYNPISKKIQKFETAFSVPKTLRVGIGPMWKSKKNGTFARETIFFYYELKGASALAAYKTIVAKFPYDGLANGCIDATETSEGFVPTGKLSWDPTPRRQWRLSYAEYSLKRGSANEVDDIYSSQLDDDFDLYLKGSLPCNSIKQSHGSVQSWRSIITSVYDTKSKSWKTVPYDGRFSQPPLAEPSYSHEIIFKNQDNGGDCLQQIKDLQGIKNIRPMESIPGFPPWAAYVNFNDPLDESIVAVKSLSCVESVKSIY